MTMRLVFVNHCHPDTPHVCATRVARMAESCARAGHQVVLLTQTLDGHPPSLSPTQLPAALDDHDWSRPLLVDCPPRPAPLLNAVRDGRVRRWLRLPLLAAFYGLRSGLFTDWRDGAAPYGVQLARHFRPQCCWATFGNTDAWVLARQIAQQSGGAWVADLKDPWRIFIPAPLRRLLAKRFAPKAFTALSDQHGDEVRAWFGQPATTIYSGIDDGFLAVPPPPPAGPGKVLIIGALYDQDHLNQLTEGLRRWGQKASIIYAGSEGARLRDALPGWDVESPGYVDLGTLRQLAAQCHVSLYVRNPRALYQHKLVELLALDRPVLCLPEEAPESLAIAQFLGADFRSCGNADALVQGLAELVGRHRPVDRSRLAAYSWESQAEILLKVLA